MLEVLRRGRRWGTAVVVVLVGGVFVIYFGLGGPVQCAPTGSVVAVGDRTFYREDFLRLQERREAQIREMAGEGFDPEAARDFLRANTASTLVTRAILAEEAERLGLDVTKEEIRERIRSDPGFQDDTGRFRVDYYESWVQYEYGTEAHFLEMQATELLAVKLARLLQEGARVSEAEAREAALHRAEEVRLAFVALDPAEPARLGLATEEIPPEEVEAFAAEHAQALRERYESQPERWETPAAVRLRHILIRTPADGEETAAEARARAEAALERIRSGADFADVARELSEEEASRAEGGDLGFVPPEELSPTLRRAAESLEPAEVSDVLEDEAGFHLVRLEGRRAAGSRAFEEVRRELAREMLIERRAEARARELAEALRTAVTEEGLSLEAAAREHGLTVERTGWLRRRPDGFVPGLGADREVQDAAFALEPGSTAPRIFEVEDKLALVQVLERRQPDPETLEARIAEERERLLARERERLLMAWVERRRDRLEKEGRISVNLDLLDQAPTAAPPPGGVL